MVETIVLGLDGANWALLDPWLEEGILPNFGELRSNGVFGDMQSCLPPVTCPNWRCYSTGKNPGKLGVFWWEKIDTEARTLSTPNSRSFKSSNFWDYLNDEGLSAGVMNLPMTYPLFALDGFMIAGGPGSEQHEYTYPESLEVELENKGYRLHPNTPVTSKEDTRAAEAVVELIDDRLSTFRDQLKNQDVDVAHCTVFYINVLQHFFWRGGPTKEAWRVIDRHIGELRNEHPDANVFLMSDHGCTDIETVFYANSWLEQEGYLTTERETADAMSKFGINKKRVSKIAHRFGVHELVVKLTPERVKDSVPEDEEGFKREQKLEKINWKESKAIASGQGLIYVIDDDSEVTEAIISDLSKLRSELDSSPIAAEVLRREDAYQGPYTDEAPNVVFDQRPGVHTSGAIGDNPVFAEAGHWEAENVRTGLFLASGPDVAVDGIDDELSITDVAPTMLRSVGCSIPEDMDGTALDLFDDGGVDYRDPIPYTEATGQSGDEVQSRLEDLGYLE